jgi:hypothetical protein
VTMRKFRRTSLTVVVRCRVCMGEMSTSGECADCGQVMCLACIAGHECSTGPVAESGVGTVAEESDGG